MPANTLTEAIQGNEREQLNTLLQSKELLKDEVASNFPALRLAIETEKLVFARRIAHAILVKDLGEIPADLKAALNSNYANQPVLIVGSPANNADSDGGSQSEDFTKDIAAAREKLILFSNLKDIDDANTITQDEEDAAKADKELYKMFGGFAEHQQISRGKRLYRKLTGNW